MSDRSDPRPNGTTMEGMIWNANHVLGQALSPHINGLPKSLFRNCIGIVTCSSVQLGFILAGTTGSGIAMKKMPNGKWSPPCAVGLTGLSLGILMGISAKDLVIFVMDQETIDSLSAKHGFKLGSNLEVTVALGRAAETGLEFTKKGLGSTFAVAYTKGAFAGLSIEGSSIGTREFVNNKFYMRPTTATEILDGQWPIPTAKVTMMQEVYDKLDKLAEGETAEVDAAEKEKQAVAKEVADKEAATIADSPEVVKVDAEAEAAKEAAAK